MDKTDLTNQASQTYNKNFKPTAWFGRCIFLSWYCDVGTCKFCFRSVIKHRIKHAKNARRSMASILTDTIISKKLGWRIEFLTGGYRIFPFDEIVKIAEHVSKIYGEKTWVNLGALTEEEMLKLKPYVEGICASIETVDEKLHNEICPNKPIQPYSEMLKIADELGFKKSITIVIGLGEKKEDFQLLEKFISEHKLDRITFYALKPVRGTPYTESPSVDDYSWWIAKTRISFPKIEIIAGLTPKRPDYTEKILKAGANAITKFPVIKRFNSADTKLIEEMVKKAGREFKGSLTRMPEIDAGKEISDLNLDDELKQKTEEKLKEYLTRMKKK